MTNEEAKKELKDILEVASKRDCCDVEINSFREDAIKVGISALGAIEQFRWERDIAISQLKELGLSLGQKIDGVYLTQDKYNELLEYKAMYEDLCR